MNLMVNKLGFGATETKAAKGTQKMKSEVNSIATIACLFSPDYTTFQGYIKLVLPIQK